MSRLSEQTLSTTLAAVRSRRHRQYHLRSAALVAIVAALVAVASWKTSAERKLAAIRPPAKVGAAPPIGSDIHQSPTIRVFSTEDRKPLVNELDDEGLARMLEGRSYGTYVAADGHRQLWVPES